MAFRFAYNLGSRLYDTNHINKMWRVNLRDMINWQAIFQIWREEKNFSKLIEIFNWASKIGKQEICSYLNSLSSDELAAYYKTLAPQERSRFLCIVLPLKINKPNKRVLRKISRDVPRGSFQDWFLDNPKTRCGLVLDDGAIQAISDGYNLLPVGTVSVLGDFNRNEAIPFFDIKGETRGVGIVNYNSADVEAIKGKHSSLIEEIVAIAYERSVMQSRRISITAPPKK